MNNGNSETDKKTHQQQILFSESELLTEKTNNETKGSESGKQVIFDNQDYLPIDEHKELPVSFDEIPSEQNITEKKSKPRWLWRIALTLFAGIVIFETIDFFITGFSSTPFIASVYAVLLFCLVVLASSSLFSEWSTLLQFKRREKLKQQAYELLDDNSSIKDKKTASIDVKTFCQQVSKNLPCDLVSEQEKAWQDSLNSHYSDTELLNLYSRIVLAKVDEKAMAEIAKFSTEAVVLVSVSPIAFIDMLIILWRNLRMINKVALLYGIKLGYWSRIKLIRQVFINMVYAGASELITDFGSDIIGADLLGKLSGRLAQGLGAGMLTARLGVKTMQLCRPIPFKSKPKLTHIRKEMLKTIKSLINGKS